MDRKARLRIQPKPQATDAPTTQNVTVDLTYVKVDPNARLDPGQCTVFLNEPDGSWYLRFCFVRITDGKSETRAIPVAPNKPYEKGQQPWGLLKAPEAGKWQVSPSISALEHVPHPDFPEDRSKDTRVEVWHQTPAILGVPDDEPWTGIAIAPPAPVEDRPAPIAETQPSEDPPPPSGDDASDADEEKPAEQSPPPAATPTE